jgi:hypothetical protein
MKKKSLREMIFFMLVFLLFFLACKLSQFWEKNTSMNGDIVLIIVGVLYTLCIVSVFFISKIEDKEGFWDITPPATCAGGPYFWQGDNENSRMCRELSSTPEGMIAISGYNCPTGLVGRPGLPFYYTPLSNDEWQNERCADLPDCKGVDVGMCSMEKQV